MVLCRISLMMNWKQRHPLPSGCARGCEGLAVPSRGEGEGRSGPRGAAHAVAAVRRADPAGVHPHPPPHPPAQPRGPRPERGRPRPLRRPPPGANGGPALEGFHSRILEIPMVRKPHRWVGMPPDPPVRSPAQGGGGCWRTTPNGPPAAHPGPHSRGGPDGPSLNPVGPPRARRSTAVRSSTRRWRPPSAPSRWW